MGNKAVVFIVTSLVAAIIVFFTRDVSTPCIKSRESIVLNVIPDGNSFAFGKQLREGQVLVTKVTCKDQLKNEERYTSLLQQGEWPEDMTGNFLAHMKIELFQNQQSTGAVWFPFEPKLKVLHQDFSRLLRDFDYQVLFYEYDSDENHSVSVDFYRIATAGFNWQALGNDVYRLRLDKNTRSMDHSNKTGKLTEQPVPIVHEDTLNLELSLYRFNE